MRDNFGASMTFAYVGYVWALLGCSFLMIFVGAVATTLYLIGKRTDRRGPRPVVEVVGLRQGSGGTAEAAGPALAPGDDAR